MKEILKWEDNKLPVKIGRMGENEYTQVVIDCSVVFSEFPSAIPAMTIQPPSGDAYPAIATRNGNNVVWVVNDSDLAQQGFGEMQVTFTSDNVVVKSCIWRIAISKSLTPTGDAPTPVEDWLVEANTALNAIPQTIDDALQEAKDSGEFDGKDGDPGHDGFSPIITVTDIAGGHRVTITDATGSKTVDVMDGEPGDPGEPGADGVSPTVAVSPITDGHRVTITDKTGSHSFDVMDGEKGDPGDPGDPTELIDDSSTAANKAWSAKKSADEVSDLKTAYNNSSRLGEEYYFYNSGSGSTTFDLEFPASSDTTKLVYLYSDSATVKVHIYRKVNGDWESVPVTGFTNLTGLNVGKYFDVPIISGTTAIRIYIFNNTGNAVVSAYLCKKKTDGLMYDISSAVQELIESASGFSLDSDLFVNGTIVNGAVDPSVTCRAVTAKKVKLLADVYFKVANGFRVYFTPSSYDWVTGEKKIAKGEYFITIARVTETSSEVADIPTFVSKVYCAYDIQKKLKETEDKADESLKLNSQICKAAFDNETPKASSVVTHADGTTGSYNGWYNSNKMILAGHDGDEINYTAPSYNVNTTNIPAICFFDISGSFLGCSTTASGNNYLDRSIHSAIIPNGTYYITITSYSWNNVDNFGKAWANAKYNKNNILTSNKLFNDANIICIGDSLTEGDYGSDPAGLANIHQESYPYFMQKYLGNNITNAGRAGYNTKQYYTNVINANTYNFASYDVVVIMLGTNSGLTDTLDTDVLPYNNYTDYADTQTGNYCKIIESIMSKNPDIQIVLCTSPYVDPTRRPDHAQTTADANAVIPKIAELYCLPVIDTYNELGVNAKNTNIYQPVDGLHGGIKFYSKLGFFIGSKLKSIYNCVLDNVGNLAWITIPHGRYYVSVGNTVAFAHNEYPAGTPITWESANPSIATVDNNGVVTGVSQGLVWIYAKVTDANGETHSARQDVSV